MTRQYLSRARLAEALDVSESQIGTLVQKGVIPRPLKFTSGCVRWRWADVDAALASMAGRGESAGPKPDELEAISNAFKKKEARRDRAA